jgi:dTDP-4-amino-4,6-dideoxygalactose transaminase
MLFVNNGTSALQIAIKALNLEGEIITTPYSYVATTNSIVWQNCKPVFVDIEAEYLNIDPSKIEESITAQTSAILATHVYGNPCDVEAIQRLANKHSLKVIYDAAHCFGVKYKGESIFKYGDISATSFHATKVFHTVEGGGLFTMDDSIFRKMKYLMNFGHDGPYNFQDVGINAKNSEFHAAMGICNLKHASRCLEKRRRLAEYYDHHFKNLPIHRPKIREETQTNFAYYPVIFESSSERKKIAESLRENEIETRSYFKPSLNNLNYVDSFEMPISESIAERVLCLPFYFDLSFNEIDHVMRIIRRCFA